MSIEFTLWSLSATAYQQAVDAGRLTGERTGGSRRVADFWDLLTRVLVAHDPAAPAASAITGGHVLENDELEYGGTRVFSPYEVALLAAALDAVDEAEFDRRFKDADFTDAYGADVAAPGTRRSEILAALRHLQTSYNEAARRGDGVAIWLG